MTSFDPIRINCELFARIWNRKDESVWSRVNRMIFGSRIKHKFEFKPLDLFKAHNSIWNCWSVSSEAVRVKFASLHSKLSWRSILIIYL